MVAIKDTEMPRWCGECRMLKEETINGNTSTYCELLNQDITWNGNRVDDCPLIEIEERKEGKWEYKQLGFRVYGVVCTNSGYVIHQGYDFTSMEEFKDMVERKLQDPHITMDKFCCKCGAEMRGDEE